METICKTSKDLADALKNDKDEIFCEIDLGKKILRIKAVGKVAWGVCAAAIMASIALIVTTPAAMVVPPAGGVQTFASLVVLAPATAILGSAAATAVAIGVCAGGVGILTKLRDRYKVVERDDKYIKLKRKK